MIKKISKSKQEALVERDGVSRTVRVNLIDDPREGDYVIVHAGFAIEKVDAEQAMDDIAIWQEFEAAMKEAQAEVMSRTSGTPRPAVT